MHLLTGWLTSVIQCQDCFRFQSHFQIALEVVKNKTLVPVTWILAGVTYQMHDYEPDG